MLEFVPKRVVFEYLESTAQDPLDIGLLTIQAAGIMACTQAIEMSRVAEAVTGKPALLKNFDRGNELLTLDLSEPSPQLRPPGQTSSQSAQEAVAPVNLLVSCGQFDSVENAGLESALEQMLSFVKPGGLMFHGLAFYLEDSPSNYWIERVSRLREFADGKKCGLAGQDQIADLRLSTSHATLSDSVMFNLYRSSKVMKSLRVSAQAVALIVGYRRVK